MKIETALARFLTQLEADGRSPFTIDQYRRQIGHLAGFFGSRTVEALTHEDIARYLASPSARTKLDGTPKKATSMNVRRSCVRTFFRYVHEAGYTTTNPARLVRRAPCGTAPPRTLSPGEQVRLLKTIASARGPQARRDHMLFHLMLATGIRLGSALALDRAAVDLGRAELRIEHTKGNRPEVVFLGRAVRAHLRRYMTGRGPGFLFEGRGRGPLCGRQAQRRLEIWLGEARIGRRVSPHSLRHAFAIDLYRRSGDLFLVKEALRHRSITSTTVYATVGGHRLRQAMA
jgi:site-specific recombinase XerD